LGPGLFEGVYKECLARSLEKEGIKVEREKMLPVYYEEMKLASAFRIDLLVDDKLLIELKSVNEIHDLHLAQTINYLRLGNYRLGLLINFNVTLLKNGIRRVVNKF
jgi:GxxExxY protein